MTYNVDWEGAYHAWKASTLSRQKFHYSEEFQKYVLDGNMPSEDAVRTHFRRVRDQIEAGLLESSLAQSESKGKTEVLDPQTVTVINLDHNRAHNLEKVLVGRDRSIRRVRRIIVRMPDKTEVEFDSGNPELFVLQLLGVFKGERL